MVGVYRNGKWIIDTNNNHQIDAHDKVFELGGAGDKPVVGDWNDDGMDDPGVFTPGHGEAAAGCGAGSVAAQSRLIRNFAARRKSIF